MPARHRIVQRVRAELGDVGWASMASSASTSISLALYSHAELPWSVHRKPQLTPCPRLRSRAGHVPSTVQLKVSVHIHPSLNEADQERLAACFDSRHGRASQFPSCGFSSSNAKNTCSAGWPCTARAMRSAARRTSGPSGMAELSGASRQRQGAGEHTRRFVRPSVAWDRHSSSELWSTCGGGIAGAGLPAQNP